MRCTTADEGLAATKLLYCTGLEQGAAIVVVKQLFVGREKKEANVNLQTSLQEVLRNECFPVLKVV